MDKKHYMTLMKRDHPLYGNDFIEGKVSGVQTVMCDDFEKSWAIRVRAEGTVLTVDCTEEQYANFVKAVVRMYPEDMFEFYYQG